MNDTRTVRCMTAEVPTSADARVLELARAGDTDALADLWTIYQPQLLRLLQRRGRTIAEDVASQVWIDVGRAIDRFQGDGDDFRNWIFTIAGRRAIDESRRANRQAEIVANPTMTTLDRPRHADVFDASLDGVIALLDTLQPDVAEVVMLRVIEDLPAAQVAALTGRSEGNIRVIAHRALDRLRETLDDLDAATSAGATPAAVA